MMRKIKNMIFLFFEDDEQCIWLPNDYQKHIENIFQKCKDAHQIQTLFYRRIFNYSSSIEYIPEVKAYRTNKGLILLEYLIWK